MKQPAAWRLFGFVMTSALMAAASGAAVAQTAPAASTAKAKELAGLMAEKKLESYAARVGEGTSRYVAVLVVPNVQILLVSAKYTRDTDIEYALYHKQYSNAYQDLRSGVFASERFLVDDAQLDGLVAAPGKNPQHDAIMIEKERTVFDGLHGDGKGRNSKKPLTEAYMKAFADADAKYGQLLDVLILQLKTAKLLDAPGTLR
ncbi:MAG TPA: hypothetical protein VN700_19190 [Vicinamibacterales bacterium]|nr:hypothetical protein [Vicinamibacterales bacterium]